MRLNISTKRQKEIVDITNIINKHLQSTNQKTGVCFVFVKHTTACLTTADLDPGTDLDMLDAFEAMMPRLHYRHPHNPAHVTDHILSSIIGPSVMVPIVDGELDLGTWQRVVLVELDGPRQRTITISVFPTT